ncbi:MAG: CBS domain-containing protein [Candidatus Zapsychrus exili]|nr:CBS domain-containing protein [Candidatus Zapsychrus exili]
MDGTWYYDCDMLNTIILKHVMIKDPICMKADDSIGDALIRVIHNQHKCISVVDDESKLCGVVTEIDILKAAARFYDKR